MKYQEPTLIVLSLLDDVVTLSGIDSGDGDITSGGGLYPDNGQPASHNDFF